MLTNSEIRARRAVEKLTQEQFADKLKISRQTLVRIESGDDVRDVSKYIERKYDALYNGQRLISIRWIRGVICPFCGITEEDPERIWAEVDNPENDVYKCTKCSKTFTAREAWEKEKQ